MVGGVVKELDRKLFVFAQINEEESVFLTVEGYLFIRAFNDALDGNVLFSDFYNRIGEFGQNYIQPFIVNDCSISENLLLNSDSDVASVASSLLKAISRGENVIKPILNTRIECLKELMWLFYDAEFPFVQCATDAYQMISCKEITGLADEEIVTEFGMLYGVFSTQSYSQLVEVGWKLGLSFVALKM